MNTENTATPRQRWALFCITKKDYRNEILSKEEAARLIKELGTPDYKKKSNKSLSAELLDYLKEHFDEMFAGAVKSLSVKSILEDDDHVPADKKEALCIRWFRLCNYIFQVPQEQQAS